MKVQENTRRPAVTLFVFHHAGGSSQAYLPLSAHVPGDFNVVFVDLPGRGHHARARPLTSMDELVEELVPRVLSVADGPRAFFGHSMGAVTAHQVAVATASADRPVWLGLSGTGPERKAAVVPGSRPSGGTGAERDREQLIDFLRRLGGTPEEVFEHEELLEYALGLLRADLMALEGRRPSAPVGLDTPISVFGGEDDVTAPVEALRGWEAHTERPIRVHHWPGGHFYLFDHPRSLAARMVEDIGDALAGRWEHPDGQTGSGPTRTPMLKNVLL